MESKMILIRHGITEGNQKRWYYGATDLPLVEEGRRALQEQVAAGMYPEVPGDARFYTSGLLRAKQSLEILYGVKDPQPMTLLNEMRFGKYECCSYLDMAGDPEFDAWIGDSSGTTVPPGGESRQQFIQRISKGFSELRGLHRQQEWAHRHSGLPAVSVVVCHGGVIAAIMMEAFLEKSGNLWDWLPAPGCGYQLSFSGKMDGEITGYRRIGPAPEGSRL